MRYRSLLLPLAISTTLALVACNKEEKVSTTHTTAAEYNVSRVAQNARDKNGAPLPMDQSNDPADLETTKRIHQALALDDSLSDDAKNVTVVTAGGTVTLRGAVRSDAERLKVEKEAFPLAGSNRLRNEINVEAR